MRDEDPVAEVNCQFCNKNYKVDLNELLKNWPSTAENVAELKTHEKFIAKKCEKTLDFSAHYQFIITNVARRERLSKNSPTCGRSSSGRAPPCQGGGSEFEPRRPLHYGEV